MIQKIYCGNGNTHKVTVNCALKNKKMSYELDCSLQVHGSNSFQWGYGGSGPSALAYAILSDYFNLNTKEIKRDLQQTFKWDIISKLPMDKDFVLSDVVIKQFITEFNNKQIW